MCECGWVWQNVCIFQYILVFFLFIIVFIIFLWGRLIRVAKPILAEMNMETLTFTSQTALFPGLQHLQLLIVCTVGGRPDKYILGIPHMHNVPRAEMEMQSL